MSIIINPLMFGTEFTYSVIVIVLCLMIYFGTREIYNLSKHEGIGYFRNAFLFLTLANLFRFIALITIMLYLEALESHIIIPLKEINPIGLLVTGYLSLMAILYLTFSVIHKKIEIKNFTLWANVFAITLSIISLFTGSHQILVMAEGVLLIIGLSLGYKIKSKNKRQSNIFALYMMIVFFWILSFLSAGPKRILSYQIIMVSDLLSVVVFSIIYLKIRKWLK